ncbi:NAD(P)/FAD-dependent oxidoreductase [Chitinophaga alhagiae]|uniref:NAD(P)/FAD-dependent oxidoreductase n=1 Tax=Chitinophaga alhagiae TaxID=2203219 RepID=UPI0018E578F7|nr:FAD-dependent oxidoreductase [Chitinophaga alhagiae]
MSLQTMHQYDYIIIGQGIAGTVLSWRLVQAGQRVLVYDNGRPGTASRTAAGIINPVSGRRFELAWLYDIIYPEAVRCYRAMENELGISCFHERDIWNVWPSAQMRDAFERAVKEFESNRGGAEAPHFDEAAAGADPQPVIPSAGAVPPTGGDTPRSASYMFKPAASRYEGLLHQPHGAGIIKGANVHLHRLLPAWRTWLLHRDMLREEQFDITALAMQEEGVQYKDVTARAAICCEGVESPANPYFAGLRFLPNKGEALLVEVPGLVTADIIKKSITLVPQEAGTYWAGATFSWEYANALPGADARASLESGLQQLLRIPYTVKDHIAAVRPSGMDRRPFVGMHPRYPQLGIFNGMGSKGCSLAPWAAGQFCRHLLQGQPLRPEIDIKRYFNALR